MVLCLVTKMQVLQIRGNRSYNVEVWSNQNLADASHVNDIISIFITIEKKINLPKAIFVG